VRLSIVPEAGRARPRCVAYGCYHSSLAFPIQAGCDENGRAVYQDASLPSWDIGFGIREGLDCPLLIRARVIEDFSDAS